jgi:hypothetical protein
VSGVGRWAAIGFGLYVAGGIVMLFVVAALEDVIFGPFGVEVAAGTVGLSIRNGLHHLVWGPTVALVAAPIGRRLVAGVRFDRPLATFLLLAGAALAGLSEVALNEWARDRFEYFDPDYVGFAGFAPAATLAVALAAWAALSAPRASGVILRVLLMTAAGCLALALLPSVPGLADGIDPESVPLAITLVLDAAFAVLAVLLGILDRG